MTFRGSSEGTLASPAAPFSSSTGLTPDGGSGKRALMKRALTWSGRLWLGLFGILSLGTITGRAADGERALKVGISPIFPPMVFKSGGKLAGVEVDLGTEFGRHLGRPIEWVEVRWKDQIASLNEGRTDIIMSSMSVTPARGFVVAFTQPYLVVGQLALVRRTDKALYALGFPIRPPGTVGVIKATTGEILVERDYPSAKIRTVADGGAAAKALMNKRIDLFIGDSTLVWHLAGTYSGDGLAAVEHVLSQESLAWAVRREDEVLRRSADEFLAQATRDGSLQRILKRWMAVGP